MTADAQEIEQDSGCVDYPGGPEGAVVTPELAEQASYKYA